MKNAKHERFAQELAKGETADAAYVTAGYRENRHNAAALGRSQHISTRVAELLERVAIRTELTIASVTDRLLRIADVAEQTGISTDEETGETTGSSSKHLSVARAALMDAAKLNGLVTDKVDMNAKHGLNDEMAAWLDRRS